MDFLTPSLSMDPGGAGSSSKAPQKRSSSFPWLQLAKGTALNLSAGRRCGMLGGAQ